MAGNNPGRGPVHVVLPGEPPELAAGAAQALLRILAKAYEKQEGDACEASGVPETPDR